MSMGKNHYRFCKTSRKQYIKINTISEHWSGIPTTLIIPHYFMLIEFSKKFYYISNILNSRKWIFVKSLQNETILVCISLRVFFRISTLHKRSEPKTLDAQIWNQCYIHYELHLRISVSLKCNLNFLQY